MVRANDGGGRPPSAGSGPRDAGDGWLEELLQDLDAIVWEADARTWQFTFVGGRAEEILGYPAEDWLASPTFWADHVHPEDRDDAVGLCRTATDAGRDHDFEYRAIASDGRVVWIRDIVRVVCDPQGRPEKLRGLMVDITDRKHTEQALRESEERFRRLSDATLEGVAIHDKGVILEVNRAFEELFGYARDELIGKNVLDLADPGSHEVVTDRVRSGSEEPYEARGLRRDGSSFIGQIVGKQVPFQGRTARVATIRDVTEQREAEAQLREAEERFRTLVEQLPASILITDAIDGSRVVYMNSHHERITGYSAEEYMRKPYFWQETVHPDDRDWVVAEATRTDESGEPFSVEYRLVRKDGRVIWVQEHTVLLRGPDGEPKWWQGVILDVNERKLAEEQLREAEVQFRTLVEEIPAVVFVTPPEDGTRLAWVSPYADTLLGYTPADATDDPAFWRQVIHPDDREWVIAEAERTDRTMEPFVADYRMIAKDGRTVWVREQTLLVRSADGEPKFWQGVFFDITEVKRAEEGLARALAMEREASQRLRVVDEMKNTFLEAVSHDLRTPLTAILGTALTLDRDDLDLPTHEIRDLIRRLATNARKLERLLSDLLDLDRLSRGILEPKRRPVDVSALVRHVVEGTELLDDRPVHVEGDQVMGVLDGAKVERIVENLLSNAARHTEPGTRVWVRLWREGAAVVIAVEDAGPGVPEHLRPVVFQAFRRGDLPQHSPGVGIGLSLVARFAEMHGGRAWVEERDGGGASFRVLLPDS